MRDTASFVETPIGIFTASGIWFHLTGRHLDRIAPGILQKEPLEDILDHAQPWVRSSEVVAIWALIVLVPWAGAGVAAGVALALFTLWYFNRGALAHPAATWLIRFISNDFLVHILAVASLSWTGMRGDGADAIIGMAVFLLFRFGWLRTLLDKYLAAAGKPPMNDRILQMVVIRLALRHDLTVPGLATMRQDLMDAIRTSSLTRKK